MVLSAHSRARLALFALACAAAACGQAAAKATDGAADAAADAATPADDADAASDALTDTAVDSAADASPIADVPGTDATADAATDADAVTADAAEVVSCTPGTQTCQGIKLATCLGGGDGYSFSNCFPGSACSGGACKPVGANLIIAFDTSGSMSTDIATKAGVANCPNGYDPWPMCEYNATKFPNGCTRIGVSKVIFKKALAKLDDQVTHLALFKFPQSVSPCSDCSCDSGGYSGLDTIDGDGNEQGVNANTAWYKNNFGQVLCVPYPAVSGFTSKAAIGKWMDGTENQPSDPELRADGGTPIGKTLFYVGEYLRNSVIVDGKPCTVDANCGSVNYICQGGSCVDPARSCRDTVVVLFTDGGEETTNEYFGPWVQAKRLSTGLGCVTDADCVNGATCQQVLQCTSTGSGWTGSTDPVDDKPCAIDGDCGKGGKCASHQQCQAKADPTGLPYFCSDGAAPCDPLVSAHCTSSAAKVCKPDPTSGLYCDAYCVRDPRPGISATAIATSNNVLRSPDGKPFGVRLYIVDIGSVDDADIINSWRLAMSGGGHLLGVDASDPAAFLGVLDKAFDWKNQKVCGVQ